MPHLHFMQRWPSSRAMKLIHDRVHDLTDARCSRAKDVIEIIASLNPVLRGWANYFRSGNADTEFNELDGYVHDRIKRCYGVEVDSVSDSGLEVAAHPLVAMACTRCALASDTLRKPPPSGRRKPCAETRTHGLKGSPVLTPMSFAPQVERTGSTMPSPSNLLTALCGQC